MLLQSVQCPFISPFVAIVTCMCLATQLQKEKSKIKSCKEPKSFQSVGKKEDVLLMEQYTVSARIRATACDNVTPATGKFMSNNQVRARDRGATLPGADQGHQVPA
jgi:hypothetical protein